MAVISRYWALHWSATGCGSGPSCDALMYHVYVKEVSCREWISDQQEWIPDNCQVLYLCTLHDVANVTDDVKCLAECYVLLKDILQTKLLSLPSHSTSARYLCDH